MSFTREYFEMCQGRRGDRRCQQCGWFGHMACHCKYEEVMSARQGGREGSENKWEALRTRVMACDKNRHAAHSARRGVQQGRRCWGCGEARHCLWVCPKKVALPTRGKVQQKEVRRAVEGKEVVSRKWHWNERKAEKGGYLVERREQG